MGLAPHTMFSPYRTDRDGRRRWEISTLPHSCVFGMRFPWRPWSFTSPDFPKELKEAYAPPDTVSLEVFARVSFPSDMHDAWLCTFPIHVFLPFRAPLCHWVGKELELKGRLIMRGERYSRRMAPIIQWEKEGEWVREAIRGRPKIREIVFKGRLSCLPRVGAELLSLNMRWIPEEAHHMVALREELAERERAYTVWMTDRRGRFALPRDLRRESEIVGYYSGEREGEVARNRAYNANSMTLMLNDVGQEEEGENVMEVLSDNESLPKRQGEEEKETVNEAEKEVEREKGRRAALDEDEEEEDEEGGDSSSATEEDDDEDFELEGRRTARRGQGWRTSWGRVGARRSRKGGQGKREAPGRSERGGSVSSRATRAQRRRKGGE